MSGPLPILLASVLSITATLSSSPEELLRRSDIGTFAPASFRARLSLRAEAPGAAHELEIWRSREGKTLVRFLDENERGKYLLRLDDQLWLLAPGARNPVRLSSSHRVYGGVSLDEVLGLSLAENYRVESATADPEGDLVVLELRAKTRGLLFAQVRYVVEAATERPVRAIYRLRSGREATAVEFVDWSEGELLYARRVIVSDLLRKGARTEVSILEMEERQVPEALFDLRSPAGRRELEAP